MSANKCARCGHHLRRHGGRRSDPGAPCSVYSGPAGAKHRCECQQFVVADTPETVAEKCDRARDIMERFAALFAGGRP